MNPHTQCFLHNLAWLAAAMGLVVMAYLKTGSLHSFWFLAVYFAGHMEVKPIRRDDE